MRRFIDVLTFLLIFIMISGCGVEKEVSRSIKTIDEYYGDETAVEDKETLIEDEEIFIEDEEIALASPSVNLAMPMDQVLNAYPLLYGLTGVEVDKGSGQIIIGVEVYNSGSESIAFSAGSHLALVKDMSDGSSCYNTNPSESSGRQLGGIIQSKNCISGELNFDLSELDKNRCYLVVTDKKGIYIGAFEITKEDIGRVNASQFDNGPVISKYGLGDFVESDSLAIAVKEVAYVKGHEEGYETVELLLQVVNNTEEEKHFLIGFNLLSAHGMNGESLDIIGEEVTVPKVIKAGGTVEGIVPISIPEDGRSLYITVRADESDFESKELIVLE